MRRRANTRRRAGKRDGRARGRAARRGVGTRRRAATRAIAAGPGIVARVAAAVPALVARVGDAGRLVTGRVGSAGRLTAERASDAGRRIAKQGTDLPRRVSGIASSLNARGAVLWAAALVTGIVCVWQHVHSNELASEIEALRNGREAVETEIGLLEMECAELSRRERVEVYASERLGMRYPRAGEVIWLVPSESGGLAAGRQDFVGRGTPSDTQG